MSDMPPEVKKIQQDLEAFFAEATDLVAKRMEPDEDPEDFPPPGAMLVLTGWIVSVEFRDLNEEDSPTWTTVLGSQNSGRAQRVGLASIAVDRFMD